MRLVHYTYPPSRSLAFAPGGLYRSPWSGLDSEIDRLFANALTGFGALAPAARFPVDLFEDKDHTYVRAELPGVSKDDINVEVADGQLHIVAVRKTPAAADKGEESFSFRRSIALNDSVHADQVSASYENGVLTVTLPKREEAKPRQIAVQVK